MTAIYVNNDVSQWHVRHLADVKIITDITEFITYNSSIKLAVFHIPYPLDTDHDLIQEVTSILPHCDHIAMLTSELHDNVINFCQKVNNPKIRYFVCGSIDNCASTPWMDWFQASTPFYKQSAVLDQLNPYQLKPKAFDILLGQPKPHRDYVYNYITKRNLNDQVIMTYMKDFSKNIQEQDTSGWINEPGVEYVSPNFKWTVTPISYFGYTMTLSQVVPISIYNQTAYSLVAETNFRNHYSFYTEKTVKPILGRRLFIAIAGQHHLHNLRSLGFKTFEGIIDESYDTIADNEQRWKMACTEMRRLIDTPQENILEKIRPVVEHNYQLMLTTDWYGQFTNNLTKFLIRK
jgi:hypothetical protein